MSTILDPPAQEKDKTGAEPPGSTTPSPPARASFPGWVPVALGLLALAVLYLIYAQFTTRSRLTAQLQQAQAKVAALETRAADLDDNYADTKAQLDVTTERLGLTREELERARALARQNRLEQRRLAEQLGVQIGEQEKQLGSLTGDVSGFKGEVTETRRELQSALGDLGEQSGLIASNRQELEALKRRGERDYFEFDVRKPQGVVRVGPVALRLNKTDAKRQKYTLTVLADDKQIEKKDKTLLEPVQFYASGTRSLREIVVYEVGDDRVVGYVSIPKELVERP